MPRRLTFASLPIVAAAALWACIGSSGSPVVNTGDQDSGTSDAGQNDDFSFDTGGPLPEGSMNSNCSLYDPTAPAGTDDPVALCTMQQVLGFDLEYAYTTGQGVAPSWSSVSPYAAGTGHDWRDDLGLAAALGGFYCSAEVYGNTLTQAAFDAVLKDLGTVLLAELKSQPPSGFDGEIYFRLRWAQTGYNQFNEATTAGALAAIADAYAASLQAQAYPVAASAGDAGDAGAPGGLVIGSRNADGSVAYAPAQTVMAAASLLDMAVVHAKDPDAGTEPATWAATAQAVLAYVQARARDPQTGLYYQSLVTSSDPGHDALGTASPTNDALLTETQAWVMMGLARAQDALTTLQAPATDAGTPLFDGGLPPPPPYWAAGAALAKAMATAGLFDGSTNPPTPPNPGAFVAGLVPSSGLVLTDKTSIGNAIMLGAFHRIAYGFGSTLAYELGEVRQALTEVTTCNTSLLTVVCDSNGPVQQGFLTATSKAYGLPVSPDGGGSPPGASDYQTEATIAMVEGLNQLWRGSTHIASCAP